jgi:hypothetical protein
MLPRSEEATQIMATPERPTDDSSLECLVAWKEADGTVGHAGPLSRDRAEALVEVYGRMYPGQTYWVESLPAEVGGLHLGRVRRARAFAALKPGGADH